MAGSFAFGGRIYPFRALGFYRFVNLFRNYSILGWRIYYGDIWCNRLDKCLVWHEKYQEKSLLWEGKG